MKIEFLGKIEKMKEVEKKDLLAEEQKRQLIM